MFEELFSKFKKKITKADKTSEELEREFDVMKQQYATIANSQLYQMLSEYFLAKIEINRDVIETLNVLSEDDKMKEVGLKAENRVMRGFIEDVEAMKANLAIEAELNSSPEL